MWPPSRRPQSSARRTPHRGGPHDRARASWQCELFAVIDGQRWDEYETVMHPDVEMTSPFATLHSAAEWAEFSRGFAVAMPDGEHTITERCWSGRRPVRLRGLLDRHPHRAAGHAGGEVPATGRAVTLPFCAVGRSATDGSRRVPSYLDQLAMLAQLGLVPQPEPADRLAAAR